MTAVATSVTSRKLTSIGQEVLTGESVLGTDQIGDGHFDPAAQPHEESHQSAFPLKVFEGRKTYFIGQFPTKPHLYRETTATVYKQPDSNNSKPKPQRNRRSYSGIVTKHEDDKRPNPGPLLLNLNTETTASGDSFNQTYGGRIEIPTSAYALLTKVTDANGEETYWLLPVEYWYKFIPKVKTVADTADEAEKIMESTNKRVRETLKKFGSEIATGGGYDDDSKPSKGKTGTGEKAPKRRKVEDEDVQDEIDVDGAEGAGGYAEDDDADSEVSEGEGRALEREMMAENKEEEEEDQPTNPGATGDWTEMLAKKLLSKGATTEQLPDDINEDEEAADSSDDETTTAPAAPTKAAPPPPEKPTRKAKQQPVDEVKAILKREEPAAGGDSGVMTASDLKLETQLRDILKDGPMPTRAVLKAVSANDPQYQILPSEQKSKYLRRVGVKMGQILQRIGQVVEATIAGKSVKCYSL